MNIEATIVPKTLSNTTLAGKEDLPPVRSPVFPDGGFNAWSTVAGSWLIFFGTFGYTYAFGVFQDYYTRVYITNHSASSISWIGGFQIALPLIMSIFSGRLFDSGHFFFLEICGCSLFIVSLFMSSLAKQDQYYQFFLSQGVGMGLGFGLVFVPTLAVLATHFRKRRALATGIALSGNSVGGVVFPIMSSTCKLLLKHSFGDAIRTSAYLVLGTVTVGVALLRRSPLTPRPSQNAASLPKPDIKSFFKDLPYLVTLLRGFLVSFGIYFPVIYGQLYAVQHNINNDLAFYFLAILNASSSIGRIVGNYFADELGPFTVLVPTTLLMGVTIMLVLVVKTSVALVIIAILFGFFSGAYLSLVATSLASLSKSVREVGARTGIALAISAVGVILSAPIQGALLTPHFLWVRPVAFASSLVFGAAVVAMVTRIILVKERQTWKV